MKTTVDMSDTVIMQVKRYAVGHGMTMREVLEAALRAFLKVRGRVGGAFKLRKHTFSGKGLASDIPPGDWNSVRSRIYEGHGG